jgi:hypothetical protein
MLPVGGRRGYARPAHARNRRMSRLLLALAALAFLAGAVAAGPARCVTTDDGEYACDFSRFGGDGSFTVSADGKPSFTLNMTADGIADAVAASGGHGIALPGPYIRMEDDPACWESSATGARLCVY